MLRVVKQRYVAHVWEGCTCMLPGELGWETEKSVRASFPEAILSWFFKDLPEYKQNRTLLSKREVTKAQKGVIVGTVYTLVGWNIGWSWHTTKEAR